MKIKLSLFHVLAGFVAGIGILAIIIVCIIKYMPTSRRMSSEQYFGIHKENEAIVILDEEIAPEVALIFDGNYYIDYSLVQHRLNSRFHWDASEGILLFTTATQIYEITPNSTGYTIDGEEFEAGYEILKTTSSGMYLSMNFLQQFSNLKCEVYDSPQRIVITFGSANYKIGRIKKNSVVRYLGGIKSPIITEVSEDTTVFVLEEMEHWTRIRTADGYIGYVKNNRLKDIQSIISETWYQGPEYTSIHLDSKVNLVWHQIDYPDMNSNLKNDIASVTGVNVISPTWYFLSDSTGNIDSYANASYVKRAHKAGLQVWALISNFNENVNTTDLLASRAARTKVQNYLIDQAKELGLDGINIDFESISQEAGYDYVQFMRELSILCRQNQIILSVDVPVPMEYSRFYNRQELGNVCDYVIVMGYDEHYYGCDTAGSVASLNFERTGLENMLKEVSREKLICGIPFYSRIWYTGLDADGSTRVTSELVTMNEQNQRLMELGIDPHYDENTEQNYAEWTNDDGRLCQIWLEDETSIAARAEMIRDFGVEGVAAWVLGDQRDTVWDIIESAF